MQTARDVSRGRLADVPGSPLSGLAAEWTKQPPVELQNVLEKFYDNGVGVWVVGGAVRDLILGIRPSDIDLAVDIPPERVIELFPDSIPTGLRFGTITLKSGKSLFEVTTLRTESTYGDGRRPDEVEWGTSLRVDLSRRDFTMNAMAIDVNRELLHDPFNGLRDLENDVLRAVGNAAERLSEDALRILRAYRFCDRGNAGIWWPDHKLSAALIKQAEMLSNVSVERQWSEFKRIISGEHSPMVIERMCDDGILSILLDTGMYSSMLGIICQSSYSGDFLGRIAMLLSHLELKEIRRILKRLKASNDEIATICLINKSITDSNIEDVAKLRLYRHLYSDSLRTSIAVIDALRENDDFSNLINSMDKPFSHKDALANGDWLMERTGLPSGKKLGRLKEWMHRIQIERDLSSQEEMESVLCAIPWDIGDENGWPRMRL